MPAATFLWRTYADIKPSAPALVLNEKTLTWKELSHTIHQVSALLARQGVLEGDGVMLRATNSHTLLIAYLACIQIGARVIVINPKLPTSLINELLPKINVGFYWSADDARFPAYPLIIDINDFTNFKPRKIIDKPHRVATLTLTSGSSGFPKAAAHSVAAHCANAEGVAALMEFHENDRWLLSLPLFHVSGQGIVWRWLVRGAQLILRENIPLDEALEGVTHASLVPTQLQRLLDIPNTTIGVKKILLGGAVIPNELTAQAEKRGIACYCGYGLTETASTVCAKRADGKKGVGLPLWGREVKTENEQILLRGAGLALGYWQEGDLIPLTDSAGWFHTRDRGALIEGEWHILGRLDHMFISGGENIQPEDIERVLLQYPNVRQAVVTPIEDTFYGQRPVAVIEGEVSLEALRAWAAQYLAPYQQPIHYFFLPLTLKAEGIKISRAEVARWVISQWITPKGMNKNGQKAPIF